MLCHPLVSPIAVKSWEGALPFCIAIGSRERIPDAGKVVAQLAARKGVPVIWDEYEFMPHNWPMLFPTYPHSINCYHSWSDACLRFVERTPIRTVGILTECEGLHTRQVDVETLPPLTVHEVSNLMRGRQKTIRPWTGELFVRPVL